VTALLERRRRREFTISWNELLDTVTASAVGALRGGKVSFDITVSGAQRQRPSTTSLLIGQ
jgi:hypothetical protein